MKAAFLCLSMAWLAVGQTPPQNPPPAACTTCGGTCSGCVDPCGCDRFGTRLRTHLRSLFVDDPAAQHGNGYYFFHRTRERKAENWSDFKFVFGTTRGQLKPDCDDFRFCFGP